MAAIGKALMVDPVKEMQKATPFLLSMGKDFRDCLKKADRLDDTESCQRKLYRESQKMGLPESPDNGINLLSGSWSAQDKKTFLMIWTNLLVNWTKPGLVIRNAKSLTDLMGCQDVE